MAQIPDSPPQTAANRRQPPPTAANRRQQLPTAASPFVSAIFATGFAPQSSALVLFLCFCPLPLFFMPFASIKLFPHSSCRSSLPVLLALVLAFFPCALLAFCWLRRCRLHITQSFASFRPQALEFYRVTEATDPQIQIRVAMVAAEPSDVDDDTDCLNASEADMWLPQVGSLGTRAGLWKALEPVPLQFTTCGFSDRAGRISFKGPGV